MPRRVAAVDCGTNSIRLLVAEEAPEGAVEVDRRLVITRLGQGVDATGQFHPDALARTLSAVSEYAQVCQDAGVERVRFVATSAARDAGNREEFFAGVRERLGVEAEIISGDEEAHLSYLGATSALPGHTEPALVMDIGGGSTELVLGASEGIRAAISLDMGSVRLRERFLRSDPPTASEIEAVRAFIDGLLDGSGVPFADARTWLGVGGTATSLSAMVQGLPDYDRTRVHGSTVTREQLRDLADRLLTLTVQQVLDAYPTMVPGRADVICAGALIAARVASRMDVELVVSEADILDGIVAGLLA